MSAYSRSYWSLFHSTPRPSHDQQRTRPSPSMPPPPPAPSLPAGACNYRDINLGSHASNCGCLRFWALDAPERSDFRRQSPPGTSPPNTWCACGHHACYHKLVPSPQVGADEMQDVQQTPALPAVTPHTSNRSAGPFRVQRQQSSSKKLAAITSGRVAGRSSPRAATPPSRASLQAVRGTLASPRGSSPSQHQHAAVESRSRAPSGLGLYTDHGPDRRHRLSAAGLSNLIPADSLLSTRCPSQGTTEVDSDREKPVGSALSRAALDQQDTSRLALEIPRFMDQAPQDDMAQSATEVATPSNAGTPALKGADFAVQSIKAGVNDLKKDLAEFHPPLYQHMYPTGELLPNNTPQRTSQQSNGPLLHHDMPLNQDDDWKSLGIGKLITEVASLRHAIAQTPSVAASIRGLSCRVDALENFSFSHVAPVEDLSDKFELFDGRLLEIEGKVDDLEKFRQDYDDDAGLARSRGLLHEEATSNLDRPTSREAAIERLQTIEEKLYGLEGLHGPSVTHPLDVEVVLIPWGRKIQGLWTDPESSKASSGVSEATQSEARAKPPLSRDTSGVTESLPVPVGFDEWSRFSSEWKVPRACGPTSGSGGRSYERLQSRGFVRSISLTDKSSRHVYSRVCEAFGELLDIADKSPSQENQESRKTPEGPLLAFRSAFIPLRKIHKSSRLQMLSEAELATPSLWTASFLDGSVFMKAPNAGLTRLYVTTASAYLQTEFGSGWTWQKLRELPRVTSTDEPSGHGASHNSSGVDEADAREPCWEWDERLDPPMSASASFSSAPSNEDAQKQLARESFASSHPLSPQPTEGENHAANMDDVDSVEESEGLFSDESSNGSADEYMHPAPITPITDIHPSSSRLSLVGRRTNSVPASDRAGRSSPDFEAAQQKRAAISFDTGIQLRRQPDLNLDEAALAVSKRRRLSHEADDAGCDQSEGAASIAAPPEPLAVKSPHDPAQHAYATPYSWSGGIPGGSVRGNWQGTEPDTDVDIDMSDDDEYEGTSDPAFASDDDDGANDDELEHALTMDEEAWDGVGDGPGDEESMDDDSDGGIGDDDDDNYDDYDF